MKIDLSKPDFEIGDVVDFYGTKMAIQKIYVNTLMCQWFDKYELKQRLINKKDVKHIEGK